MVGRDPAQQAGPLAGAWAALRSAGWRRLLIGLYPLLIALALGWANQAGWFRASDLFFFDQITLREPGRKPKVVVIEIDPTQRSRGADGAAELARKALQLGALRVGFAQDAGIDPAVHGVPAGRVAVARSIERVPGSSQWRFVEPPPASGVLVAAQALAPAERGLHRRQLSGMPGPNGPLPLLETTLAGTAAGNSPYLVHLPRDQNIPRLAASQVLGGALEKGALRGMLVLVEPAADEPRVVTARDPAAQAMALTEYRALALQTLVDGRPIRELPPLAAALLLLALSALAGIVFLRSDPKRIIPLLLLTGLSLVAVGSVVAVVYANLLLPITALALALPLAALLVLQRAELDEDRSLRRFVTQTINLNSRQVLLTDLGRLPGFLASTAPLLGIDRYAIYEDLGRGRIDVLSSGGEQDADLPGEVQPRRSAQRLAMRSGQPASAEAVAPHWGGVPQIAALGPAHGQTFWLYRFAEGRGDATARDVAAALARDYRAIQQLRADLSAGSDQSREYRPADEWAGGAVDLIARQGRQVAGGMDGLETAIMVFHPIGFPIHANVPMARLYERIGMPLADTTLPALLAALTELEPGRIDLVLNELALHGGEMRIRCRDLDTRARLVRVAAARDPAGEGPGTLVVEAIDVTEPQRLAQLRLSISNLLDVNIRNDLEAIAFAVAMARNPKLDRSRLDRALAQIDMAALRAAARLDEMAPHMHQRPDGELSESYPIDAGAALREACDLVAGQARELNVGMAVEAPAIAGFTIADPRILVEMIEAMLQIVIADTPQGEAIKVSLIEEAKRTQLTISGGIGMAFQRLYAALETAERLAPGPFRTISRGMAASLGWGAVVSYSSEVNRGYRFVIDLRRIA